LAVVFVVLDTVSERFGDGLARRAAAASIRAIFADWASEREALG
jgi:hypothetical protein